jgi:CHAD domain-containing protein
VFGSATIPRPCICIASPLADFRTFSRMLDDNPTDELRDELRWLGQAAGPVRDLDVLGDRFEAHACGISDVDQPATSALLTRLAASRFDAHQRLLAALRSQRYDRTLRLLVDFAAEPPVAVTSGRKAVKPAADVARRSVRRRWSQLAEAWLRDTAVDLVDCRVAIRGLIAAERHERARIRRAWPAAWHRASKRKIRAWL